MTTTDARRVAAARRWFRRQGLDAVEQDGVTIVQTPAHPQTWDMNFVEAGPNADPQAVLRALNETFDAASSWVVHIDSLTDPGVEAALALAGFREETVLIEMLAVRPSTPRPSARVTLTPVGDANWSGFAALADADMREGKRTGEYDARVAAGLMEGMRRRLGACDYWVLEEDGTAIGYGMTAVCPNGLGLIENLFTLPEHRGRGVMSGFILEAAERLRAAGCDGVFLDAHAHDTPKHLYARLGFAPVALTRTWVKRSSAERAG